MTQEPDELARRAAAGDAAAIEQLLDRHLPSVHAFVRAHMSPALRAKESTSDLVQSVCRELLTHRDRFQHGGDGGFQAWLFLTARRKIANRARDLQTGKRAAHREANGLSESAIAQLGAAYARVSSPSGNVLRREEIERLEAAMDRLDNEHREVITLAHLAGLSRAAIGAQLGKSEEAVRALLHRAMARLAILMGAVPPS